MKISFFLLQEIRQRGRFAGFSLYLSNTSDKDSSFLCYKDEEKLPPLNFTTTCITSGRYVIFYNERRLDVSYPTGYELSVVVTELCEVNVLGKKNLFNYTHQINDNVINIKEKILDL